MRLFAGLVILAFVVAHGVASLSGKSANLMTRVLGRSLPLPASTKDSLLRAVVLRGGTDPLSNVAQPMSDRIFSIYRSANPQTNALFDSLERATTVEDTFQIMEEIPAIKNSMDRAMKIATSTLDDAVLAVETLSRVAKILGSVTEELDASTLSELNQVIQDRRIEQLTEVIELQLSALRVEELSKYLWSLVMIDLADNEYFIKTVLMEFADRLRIDSGLESGNIKENSVNVQRLTKDEKAMIIWALGCVQERYPSTENHDGLLDRLLESLLHASSAAEVNKEALTQIMSQLNPQLVVRMMWSLSIHGQQHMQHAKYKPVIVAGLHATAHRIESLSLTNKITLLWCSAQHSLVTKNATLKLMRSILSYLQKGALDRDDLHYVIDSVRVISGITRTMYISLCDEETLASKGSYSEQQSRQSAYGRGSRSKNSMRNQQAECATRLCKADCIDILLSAGSIVRNVAMKTINGMNVLPLDFIIVVFKAVAAVELHLPEDRQLIPEFSLKAQQRVIDELEGRGLRGTVTPRQAAGLLEALVISTDYPSLLSIALAAAPSNSQASAVMPGNHNVSSPTAWEVVYPDPVWHKIAGRLAVISSIGVAGVASKAQVVDASWAIACLSHSYRPLFRVARRATQYVLHEQTPETLSRLAVSIASEEAASFASGGGMSVKLDHEFVDQVAISMLNRLRDVPSMKEMLHAVVSVAFLGRVSSSGTRLQWNNHPSRSTIDKETVETSHPDELAVKVVQQEKESLLEISQLTFSYLTTKQLIRFQWALGRLPLGIFSPKTISNLRVELDKRELNPCDSDIPTKDRLSIKDSFLFVKTLVDSAAIKDNELNPLKSKVCSTLLDYCKRLFASASPATSSAGEKYNLQDKTFFMVANPSILIDTLQAFIELNWYSPEMHKVCSDFVRNNHLETDPGLSQYAQRAVSFQHGILDELLKVYAHLPHITTKKGFKKLYTKGFHKRRLTGFLMKVLGVHESD